MIFAILLISFTKNVIHKKSITSTLISRPLKLFKYLAKLVESPYSSSSLLMFYAGFYAKNREACQKIGRPKATPLGNCIKSCIFDK